MTNRIRNWSILLACLLALTACASAENNHTTPQQPEQDAAVEERVTPDYQFESSFFAEKHFYADDGSELELAGYNYVLKALTVSNREELSAEDAEAAERNVETFNARMSVLLDDFVERGNAMGSDAVTLYAQESIDFFNSGSFYDGASADCYLTGDVISVRLESDSYTGGAHGNHYTSSYLFDLRTGQFLDPAHLAEDPEAFCAGVAKLLVKKANAIEEKMDGYWPDYEDILRCWNEGTVLFNEEGMVVVYSPYDLGPYSMGTVELTVDYSELADLIGPKGLERLGVGD